MSTEMFSPPARSNTAEKNTNGNARAPAEEFSKDDGLAADNHLRVL